MQDKHIECIEKVSPQCEGTFVFSVEEQKFFKDREYIDPKRCRACREFRRIQKENEGPKNYSTNKHFAHAHSDKKMLED